METLFGEREGVYSQRNIEDFHGMFNLIGYDFVKLPFMNLIDGCIRVFHNKKAKDVIIQHWVRPLRTSREKALADYPRPPIPKNLLKIHNDFLIAKTINFYKDYDIYFLVILPKVNGEFEFWLERYVDIPLYHWRLNPDNDKAYRLMLNRDTKTIKYDFTDLTGLKKKLDKIFEGK